MNEQIASDKGDAMISNADIDRLKQKYTQELRDSPDNPMKVCMKLIFEGATERDATKRSSIAHLLSEFLTKPDGIINLFLALIDFDGSSQKTTTHHQRFVAVANIISCLPKLCMSYEDYCDNIYHQLRPLLVDREPKYSSLASIIIKALIESPHAKKNAKSIKDLILNPISEGLSRPPKERKREQAITAIHNLVNNNFPIELSVEIFPQLLAAQARSESSLLKLTLITILNALSPGAACCLIEKTLLSHDLIRRKDDTQAILCLLESCNNELLILEFYFYFQNAIWTATQEQHRDLFTSLIEPILEVSSQDGNSDSKFDLFAIIAINRRKSLELLASTLLNYKAYLRSNPNEQESRFMDVSRSLSSCISILEVLSATMCDKNDQVIILTKCCPVLKELSELLNSIPKLKDGPVSKAIDSFLSNLDDQKSCDIESELTSTQELEFATIIKDLNDKLVPVRVHALVKLKQMVLANDSFILSKIQQLYWMIECSLADNEPYVFLACINLLAEMGVRDTPFILPKLIELHSRQDLELQNRINVGEVLIRLVKQLNETTPFYAQQVIAALLKHSTDPEELIRMSSLTNIGEICKNLGSSLGKYMVEILVCIRAVLDTDTLEVKCAALDLLRTALSGTNLLGIESIQRELKEIYATLKRIKGVTLDNKLCLQIELALDEIDRIARELLAGSLSTPTQRGAAEQLTKNIKVLSLL